MKTRFIFLRHGQPLDHQRLLGRTNPELTELGWEQMENASRDLEVDRVISSPLQRCHQFGFDHADAHGLPFAVDEAFQELDFGDWDGLDFETLWQRTDGEFERYWQQPWQLTPPGGESTRALLERVSQRLHQLCRDHPEQTLLIFSHSGVIRILLHWLLVGEPASESNQHLSRVELSHAAKLELSIYRDNDDKCWPQLIGLQNQ